MCAPVLQVVLAVRRFGTPMSWQKTSSPTRLFDRLFHFGDEWRQGTHAGVKIRNLRKVYDSGKVAVHDLSFNMFENQITALLGQVFRR